MTHARLISKRRSPPDNGLAVCLRGAARRGYWSNTLSAASFASAARPVSKAPIHRFASTVMFGNTRAQLFVGRQPRHVDRPAVIGEDRPRIAQEKTVVPGPLCQEIFPG
jgi:hypothetical protein